MGGWRSVALRVHNELGSATYFLGEKIKTLKQVQGDRQAIDFRLKHPRHPDIVCALHAVGSRITRYGNALSRNEFGMTAGW